MTALTTMSATKIALILLIMTGNPSIEPTPFMPRKSCMGPILTQGLGARPHFPPLEQVTTIPLGLFSKTVAVAGLFPCPLTHLLDAR